MLFFLETSFFRCMVHYIMIEPAKAIPLNASSCLGGGQMISDRRNASSDNQDLCMIGSLLIEGKTQPGVELTSLHHVIKP